MMLLLARFEGAMPGDLGACDDQLLRRRCSERLSNSAHGTRCEGEGTCLLT